MGFYKTLRIIDILLILVVLGYFSIRVSISSYLTEFEFWLLFTLGTMLIVQSVILVNKGKSQKFLSLMLGFTLVPVCIVSCVMGNFYFYLYNDLNHSDYKKLGCLIFLVFNFVYLITSSMTYTWKGMTQIR